MKRLLLLVSMVAFLATSCEKTEIKNEVLTPIGFSTNVGKQTKAIVDNTEYPSAQPFGVFAYGHQGTAAATTVMPNIEISHQSVTIDNSESDVWKATTGSYYWPNDPTTTLNFYAYSPYLPSQNGAATTATKNHQKLNGTISHTEDGGLAISGYEHKNMYVDYMLATVVTGAKYNDGTTNTNGKVNLTFNHQMTQILFKVKTDITYNNINFTLKSIKLNNIKNTGNITNGIFTNETSGSAQYTIFPASIETETNGAPGLTTAQNTLIIDSENNEDSEIIPVTMIPQLFTQNQSFTIVYNISGEGVATEDVTKTITLPSSPVWDANKKITYNLTIGLKEILFEPSVADWTTESSADIDVNGTAGV